MGDDLGSLLQALDLLHARCHIRVLFKSFQKPRVRSLWEGQCQGTLSASLLQRSALWTLRGVPFEVPCSASACCMAIQSSMHFVFRDCCSRFAA